MPRRRRTPTPVNITDVDLDRLEVGTPIRVRWIDARHVSTSWTSVTAATLSEPCDVVSVGSFLGLSDQELFYAADVVPGAEPAANAVSAIPLGCIHTVEQLGDPHG